ncbi:hypothetical protein OPT61_g7277 [Boeremia exigua]|uniref:Uncharacterized protein n=1 Tax=Boeremia exigua TaxID=749465 RepID=A0ACC2I2W7_9PLEO|nr:hypothetical protein OPT61_g7277 [Boeremia exigua]
MQNPLHLLDTHIHDGAGHKPANPLLTRRTRQTALIRPKLRQQRDLAQRLEQIQLRIRVSHGVVEADQGRWQAGEEGTRGLGGVDSERDDGAWGALGIGVHEVHFALAAEVVDGVVGGRVDVPADEEDVFVVEGHLGERGEVAFRVVQGEGRAVAPVDQVAGHGFVGVFEGGLVRVGEAPAALQRDGALPCAVLALPVGRVDLAPIVGGVVAPEGLFAPGVDGCELAFLVVERCGVVGGVEVVCAGPNQGEYCDQASGDVEVHGEFLQLIWDPTWSTGPVTSCWLEMRERCVQAMATTHQTSSETTNDDFRYFDWTTAVLMSASALVKFAQLRKRLQQYAAESSAAASSAASS